MYLKFDLLFFDMHDYVYFIFIGCISCNDLNLNYITPNWQADKQPSVARIMNTLANGEWFSRAL